MHKRHAKAEHHSNKVFLFEYHHPRNKHVMRRQAKRARLEAEAHHAFSKCLTRMAAEGDKTARMIMFAMNMMNGSYSY